MKPKLFVAGCSVSDYTHVDKVYGEYLSERLDYDYVHEAAGCGSNWRMWRVIINHIIDGNLTKNDLLVTQYTSTERREFWTSHDIIQKHGNINLRERYKMGGNIIRFKMDSHTWQHNKKEKEFFKLYENFIDGHFEHDVFNTQNLMFQTLLKNYEIPSIFFDFSGRNSFIESLNTNIFNVNELNDDADFFLKNDMFHFNEKGHEYVGNKLFRYINSKLK
jgi:hypothetical protein